MQHDPNNVMAYVQSLAQRAELREEPAQADAHIDAHIDAHGDALPRSPDMQRSARIVRSLIRSRAMLQGARHKSAELQEALERFKQRQSKIAIGSVRNR